MNDAAKRISRYLLMQLVINVLYGIPIGIGLYFIGVPNPILWGLLATILRFIPYIGPVLAALFPIALSFAVAPGWTPPLLTIALFVSLELFSNNVLEPWLYGSSTGLSPIAVLVAAVVWTTLWGPVGLLLSTPLTVCLVVLGRHVPQLGFFDVLLGDEPALAPTSSSTSACWRATRTRRPSSPRSTWRRSSPSTNFMIRSSCRPLALPSRTGCAVVSTGRPSRASPRIPSISSTIWRKSRLGSRRRATTMTPYRPRPEQVAVLCIGARNGLDEAAAAMLARLLVRRGVGAKPMPREVIAGRHLARLTAQELS